MTGVQTCALPISRGRKWICVAIDRMMGGRAWKAALFFGFVLLSLPLVGLVKESIMSSKRKNEQLNEKCLPLSKLRIGDLSKLVLGPVYL